ncbi:hypothetical protein AB0395_02010 [Streptosporangium sp. NPDC051023]|uniref:hypothetical protein n=1 Tax=Streptosporangium sp. NPDC051023 TaxID=3155410 RepID=UPI00344CEBD0
MGVVDSFWWSVWWPWMLVWTTTFVGFCASAWYLVAAYRRERRRHSFGGNGVVGVCIYLHEQSVMDLYQISSFGAALRQDVERKITSTGNWSLTAMFGGSKAGGGRGVSDESYRSYIEEASPITVISGIMDVLEKHGRVVYADLRSGHITPNAAAAKALARVEDGAASCAVRLSDLDDFLWVKGRFQKIDETQEGTVFLASYRAAEQGEKGPHVRITCATDELRGKASFDRPFHARCLGKVDGWNPETLSLDIQPVAIFR